MGYVFSADRALLDPGTQEVIAEGNVIFQGPGIDIRANALRYNFRLDEGAAYGIEGSHENFFFRAQRDEIEGGVSFRRLSEDQALLRDAQFTGCDFPVPHYYIQGSEVIIFLGERIFVRDAVLYIHGVPSLYLPAYTRSLRENSPWAFYLGQNTRLGGYARLAYTYKHQVWVPDYLDPSQYRRRTGGTARVLMDYFARRGPGLGLEYRYTINYGQHHGELFAYGLNDEDRDATPEEPEGGTVNRAAFRWRNRSELEDHLIFQMDMDQVSDPDIYFEILDRFEEEPFWRRPERRMRWALTYARDAYTARLLADLRDRLGRDYFANPADIYSNDLDYDPDPFGRDVDTDSVSGRRYAPVSRKLPQADFTTAHIRIGRTPLYYDSEFHAFNAKDAGLNALGEDDDAWVQGAELRQGLLFRIPLSRRVTWLHRIGGGLAWAERENVGLAAGEPADGVYPFWSDGLQLTDRDTWLTGRRERSYRDVENWFFFGEYLSRLNARFTDTLEGYLQYRVLDGTSNSLGEFYRKIGKRSAQTDIYRFPVKTHWLEARLNHFLLYPDIDLYGKAGVNLHDEGDIAPDDLLRYLGAGGRYRNDTRELTLSLSSEIQERQVRDISDPDQYEQATLLNTASFDYAPRHKRWWTRLNVYAVQQLEEDPVNRPKRESDRFDETETKIRVNPVVGTRIGSKYKSELGGVYDTEIERWKEANLKLTRDIHDAEVGALLGFRTLETIEDDNVSYIEEREIRLTLKLKTPGRADTYAPSPAETLLGAEQERDLSFCKRLQALKG